jgi:hypothetical protein
VKHVLVLNVAVDPKNAETIIVTAWLSDGRNGTSLAVEQRYCERCSRSAFEPIVDELAVKALRAVNGSIVTTKIRVESVPEGGEVQVDNVPIGVTPLETSVPPGPHTVTVQKAGYKLAIREVQAMRDETKQVAVVLEPLAKRGLGLAPWKWGTLAAGAGLAVWGGIELSRHDPEVQDGHRQARYRDTRLLSGLLLGGGVALIGTSVVLFVLDAKKKPAVDAGITFGPSGGSLTLSGEF